MDHAKTRVKIVNIYKRAIAHARKGGHPLKVNLTMIARRIGVSLSLVSTVIDDAKRRGEL